MSGQVPTYQELLSDAYENNALAKLVIDSDYADRELETYDQDDYEDNEIEDTSGFNQFSGDRNKPDQVVIPKAKLDTEGGKSSYAYDKQIRVYALNIDGRFRGNVISSVTTTSGNKCNVNGAVLVAPATNESNFYFRLSRQYKNVYSVKVTSFEFPNLFYTFTNTRGNTSFTVTSIIDENTVTMYIADGNYTLDELLVAIQNAVTGYISDPVTGPRNGGELAMPLMSGFVAFKNPVTGKACFACTSSGFVIDFPSTTDNPYGNGIGYNLGIYGNQIAADISTPVSNPIVTTNNNTITTTQTITTKQSGMPDVTKTVTTVTTQVQTSVPYTTYNNLIVGDTYPDVIQDSYVYLSLNDWGIIKHQNADGTEFTAFMKVPLTVPKGQIQFDTNVTNTTTKEFVFSQPTNLELLQISLLDAFGLKLNMNGANISMTLEIKEVLQSDIYQNLLQV
uniref:Uncharacterized protein n=1 Tax=viral metagenome TaxID=1070528 RepID=A0A6C0CII0_9ZZZZ